MSKFQIKNRFTGDVQFEWELPKDVADSSYSVKLGFAVRAALKAGADLSDANLSCADLEGAELEGADLKGVDLGGAYLVNSNLKDANLSQAFLVNANFSGSNLSQAYLGFANLGGVDLSDANLAGADLADASNVPAHEIEPLVGEPGLSRQERYARRAAAYHVHNPDVPVVENLDAKILECLELGGRLNMHNWHTYETTHCRAGWAITLAGPKGKELEDLYSPEEAGRRIYLASTGRVPNFFTTNERALADIREQAALQGKP